jgi:hypothetical protein
VNAAPGSHISEKERDENRLAAESLIARLWPGCWQLSIKQAATGCSVPAIRGCPVQSEMPAVT